MLDWIFSQKCRNSLSLLTADQLTSEKYKMLDAIVPDELLAANASAGFYQTEEYENSSFVAILPCLNTATAWHFSLFICTA